VTQMRHLSDESLMDALEGAGRGPASLHLASCMECAGRLAAAREGIDMARAATVPEPPGLYWESFPRQVARRIDATPVRRPWGLSIGRGLAGTVAVAAAIAIVMLARPQLPREPSPERATVAQTLPAWSPLPAAEEDPGLPVLQALGSDLAPALECGGVAECLADLSDEETQDLVQALRPAVKEGLL
jgi:hypothetical protein